jgi:hypothetical protein
MFSSAFICTMKKVLASTAVFEIKQTRHVTVDNSQTGETPGK